MADNTCLDRENTSADAHKTHSKSKTSVKTHKSGEETNNITKKQKSSSTPDITKKKKRLRMRSKTAELNELKQKKNVLPTTQTSEEKTNDAICDEKETNCSTEKKIQKSGKQNVSEEKEATELENQTECEELYDHKKKIQIKASELFESSKSVKVGFSKPRPSEIPKLKTTYKINSNIPSPSKISNGPSKLPVKTKEFDEKQTEKKLMSQTDSKVATIAQEDNECTKSKPESMKLALKSYRVRREAKLDEKIKETMKKEFGFLIPLYESEFRKINEIWVNTLYCSLTMRTNLIKLLYQALPQINKDQFQAEDENLLHYITNAKDYTKSEADNLLQFIRLLQTSREKCKEQYTTGMINRGIAQTYNHDWRALVRKITDAGEEIKRLQSEVPELQKKKKVLEEMQKIRLKELEENIFLKEAALQKLFTQLNFLKEREANYRKNIFLKDQDYKDIKADVMSLKSTEKEYEDIKAKFSLQNELYKTKIRELQALLLEKKKMLEKEKNMKQKLRAFLDNLKTLTIGKEQVEYVMGQTRDTNEKRREQLWLAAVKLVLRGFLIQTKKLEKDRNKMLLELQSNDSENLNALAVTLLKRDHFIKSVKQQMNDFQNTYNKP